VVEPELAGVVRECWWRKARGLFEQVVVVFPEGSLLSGTLGGNRSIDSVFGDHGEVKISEAHPIAERVDNLVLDPRSVPPATDVPYSR